MANVRTKAEPEDGVFEDCAGEWHVVFKESVFGPFVYESMAENFLGTLKEYHSPNLQTFRDVNWIIEKLKEEKE